MNQPVTSQDFAPQLVMHTSSVAATPAVPIRSLIYRLHRRARWLAVRLVKFLIYCADRYSAAVQYEELAKLSDAQLERRGIARGDLHRHVADASPKWQ